ncbi:MAG: DUF5305 family protein [Chloroflexota bacterium]
MSLIGVFAAGPLPTEFKQETELVNYEHTGEFDYQVTLKPSYLFGPEPEEPPLPPPEPLPLSNPQYPIGLINRFNFNFGYEFVSDRPVGTISEKVKVTAVVKDTDGKTTEITLLPETSATGSYFTISFPLAINAITSTGDITINMYVYPTIQTDYGLLFDSFVQRLNLKLQGPNFEVDRDLEYSEVRNSGTLIYEQKGTITYSVLLNAGVDNPFGPITILPPEVVKTPEPEPVPVPPLRTVGPTEFIFPKLVDNMTATFAYRLEADKEVRDQNEQVIITAALEAAGAWSKTFVLVPPTKQKGNFTIRFPLDIAEFFSLIEVFRTETGVSSDNYTLNIKAEVYTTGQTEFGPISELYSQTLSSNLGKGILDWNEKLVQSKAGAIKTTEVIPNSNKYLGMSVSTAKRVPIIMTIIFFLLCAFSVVMYIKYRPARPSLLEQEAARISKKYGQRMAVATDQIPTAGETTITLNSMEDLVKIADELGKPIVYQAGIGPDETHTYYVFDGASRYQYVLATRIDTEAEPAENS